MDTFLNLIISTSALTGNEVHSFLQNLSNDLV